MKLGGKKTEERRAATDELGNGRDLEGLVDGPVAAVVFRLRFGRETAALVGLCSVYTIKLIGRRDG